MSRVLRRVTSAIAAALLVTSVTVHAVSIRDIMELSRAGLSDEILLALIEADKSVFTLSSEQILQLKQAGVSDRVVIAMIQQGRKAVKPSPLSDSPEQTQGPVAVPDYSVPPGVRQSPSPAPSTTVVVVPAPAPPPVLYPYPIFVPQLSLTRPVRCTPGRLIGRTEQLTTAIPGRWLENGRTGGLVFMSDPVCE